MMTCCISLINFSCTFSPHWLGTWNFTAIPTGQQLNVCVRETHSWPKKAVRPDFCLFKIQRFYIPRPRFHWPAHYKKWGAHCKAAPKKKQPCITLRLFASSAQYHPVGMVIWARLVKNTHAYAPSKIWAPDALESWDGSPQLVLSLIQWSSVAQCKPPKTKTCHARQQQLQPNAN